MLPGDLVMSSGSSSFVVKNESLGYVTTRLFEKRKSSDTEKAVTFQSYGDSDSEDDSEDESGNQCQDQDRDDEERDDDKIGKGQLPVIE